jgi:putative serine protease PepD
MSETPETTPETAPNAPAPGSPAAKRAAAMEPQAPRLKALPVVAALAASALVGGVSGAGVTLWATSQGGSPTLSAGSNPLALTVNDPDNVTPVTAVAAQVAASVVTISVSGESGAGTGSGVVLSSDGYVLTNTHVVTLDGETGTPKVTVQTLDGRLLDAKIVGTDPVVDLAVIKVSGVSDLVAASFADSSKLNVGDATIAIGAPLGLANTVTDGIISALNRSISIASSAAPEGGEQAPDDNDNGGQGPFDFWQFGQEPGAGGARPSSTISIPVIQTDAAINPGNSGGALLDADGRVIGINVAIASTGRTSNSQSGSIGVGFAIPSNLAKRVADELITTGTASHGLLGASVLDVTEDDQASNRSVVGASIMEVVPGGAAEKAGLRAGDVVIAFDGLPVTGKTDLTALVRSLPGGATATLTYLRGTSSTEVEVTLGTLS